MEESGAQDDSSAQEAVADAAGDYPSHSTPATDADAEMDTGVDDKISEMDTGAEMDIDEEIAPDQDGETVGGQDDSQDVEPANSQDADPVACQEQHEAQSQLQIAATPKPAADNPKVRGDARRLTLGGREIKASVVIDDTGVLIHPAHALEATGIAKSHAYTKITDFINSQAVDKIEKITGSENPDPVQHKIKWYSAWVAGGKGALRKIKMLEICDLPAFMTNTAPKSPLTATILKFQNDIMSAVLAGTPEAMAFTAALAAADTMEVAADCLLCAWRESYEAKGGVWKWTKGLVEKRRKYHELGSQLQITVAPKPVADNPKVRGDARLLTIGGREIKASIVIEGTGVLIHPAHALMAASEKMAIRNACTKVKEFINLQATQMDKMEALARSRNLDLANIDPTTGSNIIKWYGAWVEVGSGALRDIKMLEICDLPVFLTATAPKSPLTATILKFQNDIMSAVLAGTPEAMAFTTAMAAAAGAMEAAADNCLLRAWRESYEAKGGVWKRVQALRPAAVVAAVGASPEVVRVADEAATASAPAAEAATAIATAAGEEAAASGAPYVHAVTEVAKQMGLTTADPLNRQLCQMEYLSRAARAEMARCDQIIDGTWIYIYLICLLEGNPPDDAIEKYESRVGADRSRLVVGENTSRGRVLWKIGIAQNIHKRNSDYASEFDERLYRVRLVFAMKVNAARLVEKTVLQRVAGAGLRDPSNALFHVTRSGNVSQKTEMFFDRPGFGPKNLLRMLIECCTDHGIVQTSQAFGLLSCAFAPTPWADLAEKGYQLGEEDTGLSECACDCPCRNFLTKRVYDEVTQVGIPLRKRKRAYDDPDAYGADRVQIRRIEAEVEIEKLRITTEAEAATRRAEAAIRRAEAEAAERFKLLEMLGPEARERAVLKLLSVS